MPITGLCIYLRLPPNCLGSANDQRFCIYITFFIFLINSLVLDIKFRLKV